MLKAERDYTIPNLQRALRVLELLTQHPAGLRVSDVAEELSIPVNSAFRITATLHDAGYLVRDAGNKRFSLTRKLLTLGYAAVQPHDILEKTLDIMRELRDEVLESVLVGTLVGAEGVVLEQVSSHHPVKFLVAAGTRFPLHTAAPGKMMLAMLPEHERERIIRKLPMTRFNDRTITSRSELRVELDRARERGYAVDCGEELEGVNCLSAPILDYRGYPVAAVWTTGPSSRFPEENFADIAQSVVVHARRISSRFGYQI